MSLTKLNNDFVFYTKIVTVTKESDGWLCRPWFTVVAKVKHGSLFKEGGDTILLQTCNSSRVSLLSDVFLSLKFLKIKIMIPINVFKMIFNLYEMTFEFPFCMWISRVNGYMIM